MRDNVHRRVALPGDERSRALARGVVLDVLAEAGLTHLADEAVIATTELATNGLHTAGTTMDLEVSAGPDGLTVTISDPVPSPLTPRNAPGESDDAVAGLNLVDTVASSWGTRHDRHGKSIWFRLDATAQDVREPVPFAPVADDPSRAGRLRRSPGWLTHLPDHLAQQLTPEEVLGELLRRLGETIGAKWAVLWLDEGHGGTPRAAAIHGLTVAPPRPVALPIERPSGGPGTFRPAVSSAALRDAGAEATVGVPVPVGAPVRGMLDLGFDTPDSLDQDSYALALLSAERMALTVDVSRIDETETRRRGFLVFLAEASELLANSLEVDLTLVLVAQLCVNRLGRWCVIHTLDEHGRPTLAATAHADERETDTVQQRFLGEAGGSVNERIRTAVQTRGVSRLPDELAGIVVPLTARRQVVGTMSIGEPVNRRHTPEEIIIAEDLGRRAGLALDNARLYQDRDAVAAALQKGLLPASLPEVDGLEFGARYVPAGNGNEVGGDFYDVLQLGENKWLLAIGDVCGKGPQAASITGLVRDVIRVLSREGRPLPYVMNALNNALLEQGDRARFCTVAAAVVERGEDSVNVQLCLAGHLLPARICGNGTTELVGHTGTAVGIFDRIDVRSVELEIKHGEALVFYTDGVTERRAGPAFFGEDNLLSTLKQCRGLDADAIAANVQQAAEDFGGGPVRDDMAVLVLRRP